MSKRGAIYTRESTEKQDIGFGRVHQLRDCRAYANSHQITITHELADTISGTTMLHDRPEGAILYRLIETRAIDALIVHMVDRIGRDMFSLNFAQLCQKCYDNGIELHITDRGKLDFTSAFGTVASVIDSKAAADYRERLIKRSREGRMNKARAGRWVGQGPAIYGYSRTSGKDSILMIDPAEAGIVKMIFAMYSSGGKGLGRIADELTSNGVPPPNKSARSTNTGWNKATLRKILTRRLYIGEIVYSTAPPISAPELAIISPEEFETAAERLKSNILHSQRNKKNEYLLSGYFACSCGWRMIGRKKETRNYYYCGRTAQPRHARKCANKMFRVEAVDGIVWRWIADIITNPATLSAALEQVGRKENPLPTEADLGRLQTSIDQERGKIKKWVSLIAELGNEADTAIRNNIRASQAHIDTLTSELATMNAEIAQAELSAKQRELTINAVMQYAALIESADYETKRFILDRFGITIRLNNDLDRELIVSATSLLVAESVPIAATPRQNNTHNRHNRPSVIVARLPIISKQKHQK